MSKKSLQEDLDVLVVHLCSLKDNINDTNTQRKIEQKNKTLRGSICDFFKKRTPKGPINKAVSIEDLIALLRSELDNIFPDNKEKVYNARDRQRPTSSRTLPDNRPQPLSLTLVFSAHELPALQELAKNPSALSTSGQLLRRYEWFWHGARANKKEPNIVDTGSKNMCWLSLDLNETGAPDNVPGSYLVTDYIKKLEQGVLKISNIQVSETAFNLESSGLNSLGYRKK